MPWTEQSPGRWQRPLGENERLIKWIGDRAAATGREHWSVTIVGTFTLSGLSETPLPLASSTVESLLRRAWILLRFRHPSIAAVASEDDTTLEYVVPSDDAALALWADETFSVVPEAEHATAGDLIAHLKPSPYTTAFFLPHTGQVVLHTSHWRTDGFGALHLLNAYFAALADSAAAGAAGSKDQPLPAFGQEPARLTIGIEEALGLPEEPTPAAIAAAAAAMSTTSLIPGSVGLPVGKQANGEAGGTRFLRSTILADRTESILSACSRHGVDWLAAVHASLAAVNIAAAGDGAGHYTSTMRFGLRPYLPPQLGGPASAAALYTGGYFAKVEPAASWFSNARFYDGLYKDGLSPEFLDARRHYATIALQTFKRAAAAATSGGGAPGRSEVDISSVGDANEIVRAVRNRGQDKASPNGIEERTVCVELEVTDLYLGVECLQRESYLFVWLFRGRLEFNLAYNETYFEESYMRAILDRVQEVLMTELEADV